MDDLSKPVVLIGREQTDHVSIRVLGRMHPGADDYWDGNWLVAPVEVVAGGFSGTVGSGLRAEELAAFRCQLEDVYRSLKGSAKLVSMEDWLEIVVEIDSVGHLEIRGRACDRPGIGNVLSFGIAGLDQSDLPAMISALEDVDFSFPVIGSPGD
jgi:hypothetical protein